MKKFNSVLAVAGLFVVSNSPAQFASGVVSYSQGSGVVAAYNNPNAALGGPATTDGYANIDPFYAPYLSSQIVGFGTGGSLTLQFNSPIQNSPANPFGLDFIVFGHAGFNITNGDYSGGGISDGSFYQGGAGAVRVSVSADGTTFYALNPLLTPVVDGLFPTDAGGNPFLPVNPALTAADFAGRDLAGIRTLYGGSAGGAGFDLAWAVDGSNQSVALASVNFVRLEGLSGGAYIDALSVVPEPATISIGLLGGFAWLRVRRKNT